LLLREVVHHFQQSWKYPEETSMLALKLMSLVYYKKDEDNRGLVNLEFTENEDLMAKARGWMTRKIKTFIENEVLMAKA
jgi:hypothetical protein